MGGPVTTTGAPPPGSDLALVLPASPASQRRLRAALSQWLDAARWPAEAADDIVLAANEAAGNVIDHAYPPGQPGTIRVHAWISHRPGPSPHQHEPGRRVTLAVTDEGSWSATHRSIDPAGHRGHGLTVMTATSAEVHIQRSAGGTSVVLVSHVVPAHPAPPAAG